MERAVDIGTRNRAATRSAKASRHASRWSSSRVISAVNSRSLLKSVSLAACSQSRRQSGLLSFIIVFALRNRVSGHNPDVHVETCFSEHKKLMFPRTVMLLHAKFQKRMPHKSQVSNEIAKRRRLSGPRIPGFLTGHILQFCRSRGGRSFGERAADRCFERGAQVRRPARTQAHGGKALDNAVRLISKLICTNCSPPYRIHCIAKALCDQHKSRWRSISSRKRSVRV